MQTTTVARDYLRGLALQCQDALVGQSSDENLCEQARYLKITVRRNGATRVQLSFPADAIERLDDLLNDDVKERIRARRDESRRTRRQRSSSKVYCRAGFSMQRNEKQVDVWLE